MCFLTILKQAHQLLEIIIIKIVPTLVFHLESDEGTSYFLENVWISS